MCALVITKIPAKLVFVDFANNTLIKFPICHTNIVKLVVL